MSNATATGMKPGERTKLILDGIVLDGDFQGHPFRGNAHVTASGESRTAAMSSRKAKRAEMKGDHKAAKSAHKAAHHSHMAAAEVTTGKTKHYHQVMAKFHGERAKRGFKMDDAAQKLDSAAEVPGLRAAIMATKDTMKRLMLARQIDDARATEDNATIRGITRPSEAALTLLQIAKSSGQAANAYASARAIERDIKNMGFKGITVRWDAAPTTAVAMDAANGLFGNDAGGLLRCDVAFKGRTFASIYVRGDGQAKVVPNAAFSGLTGWSEMVEAIEAELPGWTDDTGMLAEAVAGSGRAFGNDVQYGGLGDVVAESQGGNLPKPDDPDYRADTFDRVVDVFNELAKLGNWKTADGEIWQNYTPDDQAKITVILGDDSTPMQWNVTRVKGSKVLGDKTIPDAPNAGPDIMAEGLNNLANEMVEQVENDRTRLNAISKLAPKDAIRSDDPELIPKLQAKLAALEAMQEFMRKANKMLRAGNDAGLRAMGFSDAEIAKFKRPDDLGRTGFADYQLSNNNGVISATRKRLAQAIADAQRQTEPEPVPTPTVDPRMAAAQEIVSQVVTTDMGGTLSMTGRSGPETAGQWAYYSATINGVDVRLAVSEGGVIQVNGDPFTKGDRKMIDNADALRQALLQAAPPAAAFPVTVTVADEDLPALAEKIAAAMGDNAAGWIEQERTDPAAFQSAIMQTLASSASGTKYEVKDPEDLAFRVNLKLRAMIPEVPLPTPPVVTPNPQPAPVGDADQARDADLALLSLVASGKHADMLEPELADQIEAAMARWPDDAQIQTTAEEAINAYSNGMVEATA